MNEFEKQDIFLAKMLEDYKVGLITNLIYKPYFDWKQGLIKHSDISVEMAYKMRDAAVEELDLYYSKYPIPDLGSSVDEGVWAEYKEFGSDKYIVSYLEAIESELTNIIPILK